MATGPPRVAASNLPQRRPRRRNDTIAPHLGSERSANGGDLSWRPCYAHIWEKSMGMLLGIMFILVTASLLTLVVDRLAQRLFPITDQQSAKRRYAYRIVIDVVAIATFTLVTAGFIGGNMSLDYAHW
jgi:hypothetical protein